MKMKLYKGGKQYNSKVDLQEAIKTCEKKKSMNNRLLAVIEKKDHYIKM